MRQMQSVSHVTISTFLSARLTIVIVVAIGSTNYACDSRWPVVAGDQDGTSIARRESMPLARELSHQVASLEDTYMYLYTINIHMTIGRPTSALH